MQWLFSAVLYVQFEVSESILVISVYSGLFFSRPWLRVTLKTNKTTSAALIFFSLFSFFERLWRNGPNILSWQTAASEVIDRPACWCDYLPMEQNVSPPIPLCFSLRIVCSPALFFFFFLKESTLWRWAARENISIWPSMDQWRCVYLSKGTVFTP